MNSAPDIAMVSGPMQPRSCAALDRSFFARPTDTVAASLLGCALIVERDGVLAGGRIVETEAYLGPDDPASHAARLRNGRVQAMYGQVGVAYVYRSYGIHTMLNVVAHTPDGVGAILIRAIEPVWGLDQMETRRGLATITALCAGPGRVCQALAIALTDHGHDLAAGPEIRIAAGLEMPSIARSGRIGISRATDWPLRFFVAENRFVSAHRKGSLFTME